MARVPYADVAEDYPSINIYRAISNAPKVARGFGGLGGRLLLRGRLDPHLRETVINSIAVKMDCAYEWSHHTQMGRDEGMTDDELRALRDGHLEDLGELEQTCVKYAHKVEDRAVTDRDFDELRRHFDDAEIVELTVLAAFYAMTARIIGALDVDIDPGNRGFEEPAAS